MGSVVIDSVVPVVTADRLGEINQKLDALMQTVLVLGQQVNYLTAQAEANRRRQQEWDDLRQDLGPVIKDAYNATVEELQEIQHYVQLEELLLLVKRIARNTRNISDTLDLLESAYDFVKDAAPLTKEMMDEAMATLEGLERKGYFGFARQGMYIADQVVSSFSEEDVRRLGDNVVLILNTVKSLTQPEMMNLINNLTQGFQEAEAEAATGELDISTWGLLKQMRDPEVRRGLAVTMATLRRVSWQAQQAKSK